ncbi:MAG: T9SS type A sorting domain-containing protein [Janthinobacterium lividum]
MNRPLRFLFAVLLLNGLGGAPPLAAQTKLADYTYGGTGFDGAAGGVPTADGGFLLGGSTYSGASGEVSGPGAGAGDYWLLKTDARGRKLWDKRYGGPGDDRLTKLVAAGDGGYLLCGWSNSGVGADKTAPSRGGEDYWVVKVDAQGNKLWDKTFGSSGVDMPVAAVAAPDGGCLLVGSSGNTATAANLAPDGDRTEPLLGLGDVWVVKIDAQGAKQWDKRLGGPGSDYAYDAVAVPGGGFVVGALPFVAGGGGGSAPGGDVTDAGRGGEDYWLIKLDARGAKVWDHLYGGTGSDNVRALLATPDGGILAAGLSYSPVSGDKTSAAAKAANKLFWVLKLDAQGTRAWDHVYGNGAPYGGGLPLQVQSPVLQNNPRGGYFLGGNTGNDAVLDDAGTIGGHGDVPYDFWLADLDASGQVREDHAFGGDRNDYLASILPLPTGGVLLVGSSASNSSRDKTADSRGDYDVWAVQVGAAVLSTGAPAGRPGVSVGLFPNPALQAAATLAVDGLQAQRSVQVAVLNHLGQVVQQWEVLVQQHAVRQPLDLSALAPGVYTVRVVAAEGTVLQRLVKN